MERRAGTTSAISSRGGCGSPASHPKLLSALRGHSKVNLALDVYDQAGAQDLRGALLPAVTRRKEAARDLPTVWRLVGPPGFEPGTNGL